MRSLARDIYPQRISQFLPKLLVWFFEQPECVGDRIRPDLLVFRVVQGLDTIFQQVFVHLAEFLADLVYVVRVGRDAELDAVLRQPDGDLGGDEGLKASFLACGRVDL